MAILGVDDFKAKLVGGGRTLKPVQSYSQFPWLCSWRRGANILHV